MHVVEREDRPRGRARPAGPRAGGRRRSGTALVIVLAILTVAAALALHYLGAASASLGEARAVLRDETLHAAAGDAVRRALQRLADDEDLVCDSLEEPWAAPEDVVSPTGVRVVTRVVDAGRLFDLNNLAIEDDEGARLIAGELLSNVLAVRGDFAPTPRVAAVRDWTDPDRDGPWEDDYYADLKPPYAAADRPLQSRHDWARVAGFPREFLVEVPPEDVELGIRVGLLDLVTIVPVGRREPVPVNLNTASESVLLALFGRSRRGLVSSIVSLREAAPLRSIEPVAVLVDPLVMDHVRPFVDVRSRYFFIHAEAGQVGVRVRKLALAARDAGGNVGVLRWVN